MSDRPPPPYRVLGPLAVWAPGGRIVLAPQEHLVVTALLAARGTEVERDELAEILYARAVPPESPDPLADKVFAVGARFRAAGLPWSVDRTPFRWRLTVPFGAVDADHLDVVLGVADDLEHGHRPAAEVREALRAGLGLVLPRPFDGLVHPWFEPFRDTEAARQVRLLVRFADADRALGEPADALPLLEAAVGRAHLRTHREVWEALALAHLGTGAPAAALDVLDRGRTLLLDLHRTHDAHWLAGLRRRVVDADPSVVLRATGLRTTRPPGAALPSWTAPAAPAPPPVRPAPDLDWALFGPVLVRRGDLRPVLDGGTTRLLALLLVHRNAPVPAADLASAVRPGRPPQDPAGLVADLVERVRQRWDPDPLPVEAVTGPGGPAWVLRTDPGQVDVDAAGALAVAARADADPRSRARLLRQALTAVVGDPLPGHDGTAFEAARLRLGAWRESLVLEAVHADVTGGSVERALPDLRALVDRYPLREDLWEWLLVATARRDGREAALAVYAEAVRTLDTMLGAAPGPALRTARDRLDGEGSG